MSSDGGSQPARVIGRSLSHSTSLTPHGNGSVAFPSSHGGFPQSAAYTTGGMSGDHDDDRGREHLGEALGVDAETRAAIEWLQSCIRLKGFTRALWTEEHDATALQFIQDATVRKLVAYVSTDRELVLLTPFSAMPVAPASFVYFIKRMEGGEAGSAEAAAAAPPASHHRRGSSGSLSISVSGAASAPAGASSLVARLKRSVIFGSVNGGGMESLLRVMRDVYLPTMRGTSLWPDGVRKDFVGQLHRFMASVVETSYQAQGKTVLYLPADSMPADPEQAALDKDLVQRLEATVIHWTRQIKEVVGNQDNSAGSGESGGPLEEIAFWQSRTQDLSGISSQLSAPGLLAIVAVLREAGSSYLGPFDTLAKSIQRGSEEADDNLKFLSILKEHCTQLAAANVKDIPALLPEIVTRIRVIGSVSRYYYTEERMTGLLRKISNEVIRRCIAHIDVQQVFSGDVNAVMDCLNESIHTCQEWRRVYNETADAVAANPGRRGLLWNFDIMSIFAQVEAFMQRCRDFLEVCEGQLQFARRRGPGGTKIALPAFGGARGPDTARSLMTIEETFEGYLTVLADISHEILDVKATRWHDANNAFKNGLKELEMMMSNVIKDAFHGVTSISVAVDLLEAFSSLATRPAVKRAVDKHTVDVFALFLRQLAETKAFFEAHSNAPPLRVDEPRYAGAALWARALQHRVERDWRLLTKAQYYLCQSKTATDAAEQFEKLTTSLDDYIRGRYGEWMSEISDIDQQRVLDRLAAPLLTRSTTMSATVLADELAASAGVAVVPKAPGRGARGGPATPYLRSNFDRRLLTMLSEVHYWEKFDGKFLIPFYASDLLHNQAEPLRVLRQYVLLICQEYNSIISSLDEVEARLFSDIIRRLDRKIAPGLSKITWSAKNVKDIFVKDVRKACAEVAAVVHAFKTDRSTVSNLIDSMRDTLLIDIEKNYVHEEGQFEDRQARHRAKARLELSTLHRNMVVTMSRMYQIFKQDPVAVQKAWARFVRHIDKRVEAALRSTVKTSLTELQRAICGDPTNKDHEITPVFRLHLVLEGTTVDYKPTVLELTGMVNDISRELITVVAVVPRVEEVLPNEVKGYNATEAGIAAMISKAAASRLGGGRAAAAAAADEDAPEAAGEEGAAADAASGAAGGVPPAATAVLKAPAQPSFFDLISNDVAILTQLSDIMNGVGNSTTALTKHKLDFASYSYLWDTDKGQFMRRYAKANRPLMQFEADITRFASTEAEIRSDIEPTDNKYFILVDHSLLKAALIDHCQQFQRALTRLLNDNARKELDELQSIIGEANRALSAPPTDLTQLGANIRLVRNMRKDKEAIEARFEPLEAMYATLAKFEVHVDEAELARVAALRPSWETFQGTLDAGEESIRKAKAVMKKELTDALANFQSELAEMKQLAKDNLPFSGDFSAAEAREKLLSWRQRLIAMRTRERALAPGIEVFEIPPPEYTQLADIERDVEALEQIWQLSESWEADWASWKTGAFSVLDVAGMEEAAGRYRQKLTKMRDLKKWGVWQGMDTKVKDFQATMPLIQALGNPGLRDRHWRSLMREIGIDFDPRSSTFTLEKVMEYGFPKYAEFIEELSATANKELAIETALAEIRRAWADLTIDIVEYKGTYFKIRSTEELFQTLEDHSVNVSSMKASPFYSAFCTDLDFWEKTLASVGEIIDLHLAVQRQWMYLESIFMASEDIRKMLPAEAALFDQVNATYIAITTRIMANRNALVACQYPGYLNELESMDHKLQTIQKALDQYLENKRQAFPRFYFLSNDDLLEILGQSRDPGQVQKHIKKCFEGIQTLQMIEPGVSGNRTVEALGMNAPDGEKVQFERKVIVDGPVELWLVEVERCMRWALQKILGSCIPAARGKDKMKWIKDFPGQLLITAGMIQFVLNCEKQLRSETPRKGLKLTRKRQVLYLNKLAEIVRQPLDKVSRKKVVALITIELHARDVMDRMIKADCTSVDDFEWLSQLRLEFNRSEGQYGMVTAKQTRSTLEYGYEYQGNSGRLVITPLTDRCVLTLTTALYLQRGGAPAGPAGTGKTETVKDLAKNLGRFCVVFNCSDGLGVSAIGRSFSGLAQSGAWGCFDEFNRIEVEVLSVVAQQILAIMEAIRARNTEFMFMDSLIKLNWHCGIFITMNPGYAGRSELPDNLKSLFRPVAMMVPDLALIAEVMLQSEGFQNSRVLAKKTVTLYSLMVQQLSKQDHYDYGLRSLRGVLVCAGALKRADPGASEDYIVLRAIRDMNMPKFIKADAELFRLLLSDLFPSLELPPLEGGDLLRQIEAELTRAGLQLHPVILQKCIELRDSKSTRHCNMLVGRTLAGKSTTWKMLAAATTSLAGTYPDTFQKVRVEVINPKSISMNELYGAYDQQTMEWTDGILSSVFRMFARDERPDEKWLVLDGPVDTLWIESMNTVMDDNKTLTLINGDRIGMTEGMSLLFEVQDLAVASPATVSRAGMVYLDVADLGYQPYVASWTSRVYGASPVEAELMNGLFGKYVTRLLRFKRKECKELIPISDFNAVISLCNLLTALCTPENGLGKAFCDTPGYAAYVERWFAFCCVWSLGAAVDEAGRRRFNDVMREIEPLFPPTGQVYDYYVEPSTREFKPWSDKLSSSWRPPRDLAFSKIIVPTIDTLRNTFVMHTLITKGMHVMIVGSTGTGKTVLAQQELDNLNGDEYARLGLNFSAATSSHTVQDMIESVLEKKSKNKMGPTSGKRLVVFVDDLNMPKKDTFGSQPPLELLRQWIDYGGWYDRSKQTWRFILDMQLVAAMGPPGGGRSVISERLQSRFNVINFTFPADKQVRSIFESILVPKLGDFNEEIKRLAPGIVASTVSLYERVVDAFLPTPQKSHYLFNMRDIAKVIQGLLMASPRDFDTKESYLRLWCHECMRTISDRFTSMDDLAKFRGILDSLLHKNFEVYYKAIMDGLESPEAGPVYTTFVPPATGSAARPSASGSGGEDAPPYVEVAALDRLRAAVEEDMVEYNSTPGLIPMTLVFFRDALRHIARISRILATPRGNALLVGVGGSGRQSLARVAAFLTKDAAGTRMGVFQIEITKQYRLTEFHEDLKKLYARTGIEGRPTMFLFSDTQIKEEAFLEDINNILSSGEVPQLYTKDEKTGVIDTMRAVAKKANLGQTNDELWSLFIERVRANLHVVLCMSPVGDAFRNRTRMYPSLVSCTTADWFHEWPVEALREVATKFLDDVRFSLNTDAGAAADAEATMKARIAAVFASAHTSVVEASSRMLLQLKRHNYVTPTHYLELVRGYRGLIAAKKRELGDARNKLAGGLAKLETSKNQVVEMQKDLAGKQKIVEKASAECDALLVRIVQEKRLADEQRAEVEDASQRIGAEEAKCKEIADDAEADLAEALPALERAMLEVDKLDATAIAEVRAYKQPPDAVMTVLGAVMTLMGIATDWASAKKKVSEVDFLRQVKTYDKENVQTATLKKLKKYTERPEFDPDIVRKSSTAAAALATWVLAIELYSQVAREVEPKRSALRQAEALLAEKQAQLAKAKEQLALVVAKVEQLNQQHTKSVTEKTALQMEAAALQDKLERAEKLINGLSGERTRWEASIGRFDAALGNLPGDAVVAAAFLSYAGAFDTGYREALVKGWLARVKEQALPFSENFNFADFLADPSDVRDWNIQGLPSDQFSTENGVIVTRSGRWPLMIDPQGQATKWIKEKEKSRGLKITDLKAKDFLRDLEQAITYGLPYLLQDVEEELDPALEPVLARAIVKRGTREVLRLGDKELDFNRDFRMYITTKLANPHYTPEVSTKVALVNFAVKEQGLEAQLLGTVVQLEEPRLETQKSELVLTVATGKRRLVELENTILRLLSESKGSLLDDQPLVDALQASKSTSEEVSRALKVAEETEVKIDAARAAYRPVSTRASLLYFVLNDLAMVDPMYQFSLDAYTTLFRASILDSRAAAARAKAASLGFDEDERSAEDALKERIASINDWHTYQVYKYACRGLFERHKLLLSFQICMRRLMTEAEGKVNRTVYDFFLKGGVVMDRAEQRPNPAEDWLSPLAWDNISELDKIEAFTGIAGAFESSTREWQLWCMASTPEREPLPGEWDGKCDELMKMAVVRAVRPDRVLFAVSRFVATNLGPDFVEPPPFDLRATFESSTATLPLVFVLSPGVDPTRELMSLAASVGTRLEYCSLGQGQAPVATRMLSDALKSGSWVFLQNCHLSISWMPVLEKIIEQYCAAAAAAAAAASAGASNAAALAAAAPHPGFRLWLSSYPDPRFPISILQRGIKITTEPPRGLKANMLRLYALIDDEDFNARAAAAPGKYAKLLFSLCWFHAVLVERRKFKSLGWAIPYDFNNSDFAISNDILADYLSAYKDRTPWDAIRYLISDASYGGRVTDDVDRRLLNVYANQFFCEDVLSVPQHKLSSLPDYYVPDDGRLGDYKEYISTLPISDPPEAFGQHPNADIQSAIQDTEEMLGTILSLQPRTVADGGARPEDKVLATAMDLEKNLPEGFDLEHVRLVVTPRHDPEPLKVVLYQEVERYTVLLDTMRRTLVALQKGIQGTVVITQELEAVFAALLMGRVPAAWGFCYPSVKPLGLWFRDLQQRIAQLRGWVSAEMPKVFWLAGFTYPTAFLTALLQTAARKSGLAIDTLEFEYPVLTEAPNAIREPAKEGAYVQGLFLEGARWDAEGACLAEPEPMQLVAPMPVVHFRPREIQKERTKGIAKVPMYLYPVRTGTRERPSYMTNVDLRAGAHDADFWIKRGTAILLALAT